MLLTEIFKSTISEDENTTRNHRSMYLNIDYIISLLNKYITDDNPPTIDPLLTKMMNNQSDYEQLLQSNDIFYTGPLYRLIGLTLKDQLTDIRQLLSKFHEYEQLYSRSFFSWSYEPLDNTDFFDYLVKDKHDDDRHIMEVSTIATGVHVENLFKAAAKLSEHSEDVYYDYVDQRYVHEKEVIAKKETPLHVTRLLQHDDNLIKTYNMSEFKDYLKARHR